jgi:hypothetical protein
MGEDVFYQHGSWIKYYLFNQWLSPLKLHAKSWWACTLVLGQHAELDHYSYPANNTVTIETGEKVSYHRNGRRCILPTYQKLLLYKCTINSHVPWFWFEWMDGHFSWSAFMEFRHQLVSTSADNNVPVDKTRQLFK